MLSGLFPWVSFSAVFTSQNIVDEEVYATEKHSTRSSELFNAEDISSSDMSEVLKLIGENDSEYYFSNKDGKYVATNSSYEYEVLIDDSGLNFIQGGASFFIRVPGESYANPEISKNKIKFERKDFSEWYINGPEGLEQGFTIYYDTDEDNPIYMPLEIDGVNAVSVDKDSKGIKIELKNGKIIHHADLFAYDKNQILLNAEFSIGMNGEVKIIVDDSGAEYPIIIDPYIEEAQVNASDGAAGDLFWTVDMSGDGDVMVVGAPKRDGDFGACSNSGGVYVFRRDGTSWTEEQIIEADDYGEDDQFGSGVAISGDGLRIAIAAPYDDDSESNSGSVYIYYYSGGIWATEGPSGGKIYASSTDSNSHIGIDGSLAFSYDGSRLAAGSPHMDVSTIGDAGAVSVFSRSGSTWTEEALIDAGIYNNRDNKYFGSSVDITNDGDRIIVGSPGNIDAEHYGWAFIFSRSGTAWTLEQYIPNPLPDGESDKFGQYVSLNQDGTLAAMSSSGAAVGGDNPGSIFVYSRSGTTWSLDQQVSKLNSSVGALYYGKISSDGTMIVGIGYESNYLSKVIYIFTKSTSTWYQSDSFVSRVGAGYDVSGKSGLSISSDNLRVSFGAATSTAATGTAAIYYRDPVITITFAGTGSGTVTDSLGILNCGSSCTATSTENSTSTLTALASTSSTFVSWSGDADCSDGDITMSEDVSCVANFAIKTYTVSTLASGSGSGTFISDAGGTSIIYPTTSSDTETVDFDSSLILTATAASGQVSVMDDDCATAGGVISKIGTETSICTVNLIRADFSVGVEFFTPASVGTGGDIPPPITPPGGGNTPSQNPTSTGTPIYASPTSTAPVGCVPLIHKYLRIDFKNDPSDVIKLQKFLTEDEKISTLAYSGIFDEPTRRAVIAFQEKYAKDILTPWAETKGTGFVYLTTLRKINANNCKMNPEEYMPLPELIMYGAGANKLGLSGAPTAAIQLQASSSAYLFTKNLSYGQIDPEVKLLQKYLNASGFMVSAEGYGSPGMETEEFGYATQSALIKFQEAHGTEILVPIGASRGTGIFGNLTRGFIMGIR